MDGKPVPPQSLPLVDIVRAEEGQNGRNYKFENPSRSYNSSVPWNSEEHDEHEPLKPCFKENKAGRPRLQRQVSFSPDLPHPHDGKKSTFKSMPSNASTPSGSGDLTDTSGYDSMPRTNGSSTDSQISSLASSPATSLENEEEGEDGLDDDGFDIGPNRIKLYTGPSVDSTASGKSGHDHLDLVTPGMFSSREHLDDLTAQSMFYIPKTGESYTDDAGYHDNDDDNIFHPQATENTSLFNKSQDQDNKSSGTGQCENNNKQMSVPGYDVPDFVEAFPRSHSKIWPERELKCDEHQAYTTLLQSEELDTIRKELLFICRSGYLRRLKVLCKHLRDDRQEALHSTKLRGRDYNETCLHTAIVCNNESAADILLDYAEPELVCEEYKDTEYKGITALHLAVVKGYYTLIDKMLSQLKHPERLKLLHGQASGDFHKLFDVSGLPLTLAAWSGQDIIFELLLRYKADLYRTDNTVGNNIIHSLVEYSMHDAKKACAMYEMIISGDATKAWVAKQKLKDINDVTQFDIEEMKRKLLKKENKMGFTPLKLACRLGTTDMLDTILQTEDVYRKSVWHYGPAAQDYYDVSEMDIFDGTRDKNSVDLSGLELLIYTTGDDKLSAFGREPILSLVQKKWKRYKYWFWFWAFLHLARMVTFTYTTIMRPDFNTTGETSPTSVPQVMQSPGYSGQERFTMDFTTVVPVPQSSLQSWRTHTTYVILDLIILLFAFGDLLFELHELIPSCIAWFRHRIAHKRKCLSSTYKLRWYTLFRMNGFRPCSMLFSSLCIAWFILRFLDNEHANVVAAPALAFGWYFTMYFTRVFQNIGIFTVMLNRMFFCDLMYFVFSFLILIISFASAFLCLVPLKNPPEHLTHFPMAAWSLLRQTVGLIDLDESLGDLPMHVVARLFLLMFIILASVLLLNMLIASMSSTYSAIYGKRSLLWTKLLAEACCVLQRRLPSCLNCYKHDKQLKHKQLVQQESSVKCKSWFLKVDTVQRTRKRLNSSTTNFFFHSSN